MTKIVFSDVDGTLLDSNRHITPLTLDAIKKLEKNNIPFVITSGRGPTGIYPILDEYGFNCPIIAYGGALIMDKNRKVLFNTGFSKSDALEIVSFLNNENLDLSWGVYSLNQWIVKDKSDPRIINEERIINAQSSEGDINSVESDIVNKILCICDSSDIDEFVTILRNRFSEHSIVKSSDTLIEVMKKGITKATAIDKLCSIWNIKKENTIAFGDNYNDIEMLEYVEKPFLMSNAPDGMKKIITSYTEDNDHDGIHHALKRLKLI